MIRIKSFSLAIKTGKCMYIHVRRILRCKLTSDLSEFKTMKNMLNDIKTLLQDVMPLNTLLEKNKNCQNAQKM